MFAAIRIPTNSASYTVWWVGSPRLAGERIPVGRWSAAAPTPTSGIRDPSEKDRDLVGSFPTGPSSCEVTKWAAASLVRAIRERTRGLGKGIGDRVGEMILIGAKRVDMTEDGWWSVWCKHALCALRGVASAVLASIAAGLDPGSERRRAVDF